MEPKKNLKKHKLVEPDKSWDQELITRINEISSQIHRNTLRGSGNWVIVSESAAELFDEAMRGYSDTRWSDLPEVEMGEGRVDGDTYIQDIMITPRRSMEHITVDFNITPTSGCGLTEGYTFPT
jgi:hypothetical protein